MRPESRLPPGDCQERYLAPIPGVLLVRMLLRSWTTGRPCGCAGISETLPSGCTRIAPLLTPAQRDLLRGDAWWVEVILWPRDDGSGWHEVTYGRPDRIPERPAFPVE